MVRTIILKYDDDDFKILEKAKDKFGGNWEEYIWDLYENRRKQG